MKDDPLEPKDMLLDEITSAGYTIRARIRATRRKNVWNLILLPLVLAGIGVSFYGLSRGIWRVHTLIYPDHAGHLLEFMRSDMSGATQGLFMLIFFPLFFAAIPMGMILANSIAWLIPPARKIFNRESQGHKFTSFSESMGGLFKFGGILAIICIALSLTGAIMLKSLASGV